VRAVSEITTFFRHCPSCGRRFEIRLTGKKLVSEQVVQKEAHEITGLPSYVGRWGAPVVTPVAEDRAVLVDVKDFQYAYQCKHCGHRWLEIREEEGGTTSLKG